MSKKFSVIVPVYNTESYLERCIDSILNQTYDNFELILVDDGSKDSCAGICDRYADADSRIRVIHKENGGISSARNSGLDIMSGDYVCFIDSDDFVEKELLMKTSYRLDAGYDICSFCARRVDENNNYLYDLRFNEMIKAIDFNKEVRHRIICRDFLSYKAGWEACFEVFNAKLIQTNNLRFDENLAYGEDLSFTVKCLQYADKWIKIPDNLYNYTMRNESLSLKIKGENMLNKIGEVYQSILEEMKLKDTPDTNVYKDIYYLCMINYCISTNFKHMDLKETRELINRTEIIKKGIISFDLLSKSKKNIQNIFGKEQGFNCWNTAKFYKDGNYFNYRLRRKLHRYKPV